jgi:Flp pilus assembly protein TadG
MSCPAGLSSTLPINDELTIVPDSPLMSWTFVGAPTRHGARSRAVGRRGAASLEFALVASLLLTMLLGTIEANRYMMTLAALRTAAAEGVRIAMLAGGANLAAGRAACTGLAGAVAGVAAKVPALNAQSLSVVMSGCTAAGGGATLTVTATYPFHLAVPINGVTDRVLTEVALVIVN